VSSNVLLTEITVQFVCVDVYIRVLGGGGGPFWATQRNLHLHESCSLPNNG